jgi:hypothetical protein
MRRGYLPGRIHPTLSQNESYFLIPKGVPGMRNLPDQFLNLKMYFRILMLVAGLCMLAVLVPRSTATSALTISIVNNGGSEICHFYLSPADNDNWGPDQLNESGISPGATRNLEVSWDQSTVKLVAEDQEGCFLYTTVAATANPSWTITSETPRECGR